MCRTHAQYALAIASYTHLHIRHDRQSSYMTDDRQRLLVNNCLFIWNSPFQVEPPCTATIKDFRLIFPL